MLINRSYYGTFRTRTFYEIYANASDLISDYNSLYDGTMTDEELTRAYNLLLARFKNSHVSSTDEIQFKLKVCSTMFTYGPTWARKLEIQAKLRALNEKELLAGSKAIYNHSNNPSTPPSTESLEELLTIDDQNTQHFVKSKLEAYSLLWNALSADLTSDFISNFAKLFIKIAQPDAPLFYVNEED